MHTHGCQLVWSFTHLPNQGHCLFFSFLPTSSLLFLSHPSPGLMNFTTWRLPVSGREREGGREGGRESRVRRSGRERDGDRWEGESGSWSDPADQMLINCHHWALCQLWLSSVTVILLHFTLFLLHLLLLIPLPSPPLHHLFLCVSFFSCYTHFQHMSIEFVSSHSFYPPVKISSLTLACVL